MHLAGVLLITCAGAIAACGSSGNSGDDDDDEAAAKSMPAAGTPNANDSSAVVAVAQGSTTRSWSFDSLGADQQPTGFSFARTGRGRPGHWVVRAAGDAPSAPNVLAQEDDDRTDCRFPVAVADAPLLADVSVAVRCKPVSGNVDRACGIVWRYRDENNYYLTRANALEDNVTSYYVQDGRRVEVKRVKVTVSAEAWHTLRADMRGDHIEVYFNGAKLIDVRDSRFSVPGKIGVWTKADSRTLFDDLTVTELKH